MRMVFAIRVKHLLFTLKPQHQVALAHVAQRTGGQSMQESTTLYLYVERHSYTNFIYVKHWTYKKITIMVKWFLPRKEECV